jgi:alpha-aminoadipate/glutamate carrier protein LysW
MNIVLCPECENRLKLGGRPRLSQRHVCPRCKAKLEITNLAPLELRVRRNDSAANRKKLQAEAICPECDQVLQLGGRLYEGQAITCPECHVELAVVSLNPLELDIPMADISRWVKKR